MTIRNSAAGLAGSTAGSAAGGYAGGAVGGAIGTALGGPVGTVIGGALGRFGGGALGGMVGSSLAKSTFGGQGGGGGFGTAAHGLIGGAMGLASPLKAVSAGFGVVGKSLDVLKKPLEVTEQQFNKVTDQVKKVGVATADFATKPLKMLSTGIDAINAPILGAVGALGRFHGSATAVGSAVSQFTQMANPALTRQFALVSQDFTASIGRGLIPVLQSATKFTRGFADATFVLSGPFARLQNSVLRPLGDVFDSVVSAASPAVRMIGRFVDGVGAVIRPFGILAGSLGKIASSGFETVFGTLESMTTPLVNTFSAIALIVGDMAKSFSGLVDGVLRRIKSLFAVFGLGNVGGSIAGSSVGAAVRNVGFSSAEQVHNKMITQAFSLGTGASPEEKISTEVLAIKQILENMPARIWEQVKMLPGAIGVEFGKFVGDMAVAIKDALPSLPGSDSPGAGLASLGREAGQALERAEREKKMANGIAKFATLT